MKHEHEIRSWLKLQFYRERLLDQSNLKKQILIPTFIELKLAY